MKCMRLMNQIKNNLQDIATVKKEGFFNNRGDLRKQQNQHFETAQTLTINKNVAGMYCLFFRTIVMKNGGNTCYQGDYF